MGLIFGLGRPSGERNGNPFQYSYLGNAMDRGPWQAIVHGVAKQPDLDLVNKQQENNCNGKFTCPKLGLSFSKVAKTNPHKGKHI